MAYRIEITFMLKNKKKLLRMMYSAENKLTIQTTIIPLPWRGVKNSKNF